MKHDSIFDKGLKEIAPEEKFKFSCGPDVPCFNRCCSELSLPVTPYDALRLGIALNMSSADMIQGFLKPVFQEETGLPLFSLKMLSMPGEPCPFVSQAGCIIYEDRPGACRLYPLGRGAKLEHDGIYERFFLAGEMHCHGFDAGEELTPEIWIKNQQLEKYNFFNDLYMRLSAMVAAGEKPVSSKIANMAVIALYQPDKFKDLIEKMNIFSRVALKNSSCAIILEDSEEGLEARLHFGFDWMELVIFGQSPNLEPVRV